MVQRRVIATTGAQMRTGLVVVPLASLATRESGRARADRAANEDKRGAGDLNPSLQRSPEAVG
jgi:hypothetical protein